MTKAKTGITDADLKSAIDAAGGEYDVIMADNSCAYSDCSAVSFDFENFTGDPKYPFNMPGYEVGYEVLPSGIPVLWCAAGGDWEMPIAFCLYIGEDDEIHAYIPRDGNAFNKHTNKAFGNDEELSSDEEADKFGGYMFSMEKLRVDADSAIR